LPVVVTDTKDSITVRYLGGPTAILSIGGLRLLTDPTFDPPGDYPIGSRTLTKTLGAVAGPAEIGPIDAVLLSHDQHPDNLDDSGRTLLSTAGQVLSTPAAAERIPGVRGLAPWEAVEIATPDGALVVTAVPALHGPPGAEAFSGPVTGFVLRSPSGPTVYVSGDNASVAVVEQIADRFVDPRTGTAVDLAVLFCGAARRPDRTEPLTLTAADAVLAAEALNARQVVPIHAEGWLHFTESVGTVARAFAEAGLADRLTVLGAGVPTELLVAEVSA
jgi:L-ascorbate metabolism protein UlaG (beta-lactamase superfamily)